MNDPFDLGSMLAGAMEMQQRFEQARADADAMVFTGTAGGEAVSITLTGGLQILDVTISPEACDPDEAELLGDMVRAAFVDALSKIDAMQQQMFGQFQQPDIMSLGDLDALGDLSALGGLGGLPGLGAFDAEELDDEFDDDDDDDIVDAEIIDPDVDPDDHS